MSLRFFYRLLLFSILSATVAAPLQAAEIKIVDSLGLTRAVKSLASSTADVVLQVKPAADTALEAIIIKLINVDGISPEITGSAEQDGRYRFHNVESGTWRIQLSDSNLRIVDARIF